MTARYAIIVGLGIFALAGCHSPVQQEADGLVCNRAALPMDASALGLLVASPKEPPPRPPIDPASKEDKFVKRLDVPGTYATSYLGTSYSKAYVPGSEAGKIKLPPNFDKLSPAEKDAELARIFRTKMDIGEDPQPVKGPEGRKLTLADLQKMAREHSPLLRQAASDIPNADGQRIQAAVYYNPTFQAGSAPVSFTSGNIFGPGISQQIVTMGKRTLAEASAKVGVANAELAYRRAETDLMAAVRSNYFAVLVAEEGMKANRGLAELTDEIYNVMQQRLKGGIAAPYEPAQIGVFAAQARIAYIQARNNYLESWKMLATSIGLTMMPVTELAGSLAKELPRFDYEKSLAHVLKNHTDALTAENGVIMARFNLRLAEVQAVPDPTFGVMVFDDNSSPGPPRFVPTVSLSFPVPFFDRNQGNIKSAQASLMRAVEQPHAAQNALAASFTDAFRRMEENRQILYLYRKQMLPQQVQAFRATVARHSGAGDFEPLQPGAPSAYFGDLITSEQNLVSLVGSYLSTLGAYWQAVSDTASLLQTDDSFLMDKEVEQMPGPDLLDLLRLPCCHPCSTLQTTGASPKADGKGAHANCTLPSGACNTLPSVLPGTPAPASANPNLRSNDVLYPTAPRLSDRPMETWPVLPVSPLPRPLGVQGMSDQGRRTSGESAPVSAPAPIVTTIVDMDEDMKGGTR